MLNNIKLYNFRNFCEYTTDFSTRINVITGNNGVGKTSILEAVYMLSTGRSFRAKDLVNIIKHHTNELVLNAELYNNNQISIKKSSISQGQVYINQQACKRSSDLNSLLPTQLIYQDLFELMDASSQLRRNIIDWGVFHVEPDFADWCREYNRVLKQRNRLLSESRLFGDHKPWLQILVNLSEKIHLARSRYFDDLEKLFTDILSELLNDKVVCKLYYNKGWNSDLMEELTFQFQRDRQLGYTKLGSHNADLVFETDSLKSKYTLSRGQKKIILFVLKMAQYKLSNKQMIILLDDIFSELDSYFSDLIINYLRNNTQQVILTCHSKSQWQSYCGTTSDNIIFL